jgi:Flp pilus assembly pilin Flp
MNKLTKCYMSLQEYQRGQTMAEYGLIVAAVAVICIAGYQLLGGNVLATINSLAAAI